MVKTTFKVHLKIPFCRQTQISVKFYRPFKALPGGNLGFNGGRQSLSHRAPLSHLGEPWGPSVRTTVALRESLGGVTKFEQ